ncbi:MAG: PKD domain-containing protein [Candidatus Eiseniibacteriota bacterium]
MRRWLRALALAAAALVAVVTGCAELPIDPDNAAATADAGQDQSLADVDGGGDEPVTLDGSASADSDGQIERWSWTESGVEIATTAAATVNLAVGTHDLRLTVTDDDGAKSSDDVQVVVQPQGGGGGNLAPVAAAGSDQTVTDSDGNGSQSVTLNGSGSSDSDGTIQGWVWSEAGSQIGTGVSPTLTFTVGTHNVTLTVTDDGSSADTDVVVITVLAGGGGNQPPVADAGPDQTVTDSDGNGSQSVTLDGNGTFDADGSIIWAEWSEGGNLIGNGRNPTVTFTVGVHTVVLRVSDDQGAIGTDTVLINVLPQGGGGNQSPTAAAGTDQTVTDSDGNGSQGVTLNGSGSSDPDGTIVSWVWREGGSQIATGSSPGVSFAVGAHTVVLTVTDDGGLTDTDTVVITVNAGSTAISFSGDIQPYLNTRCTSCHGAGGPFGVDLRSYGSVMAGGTNGPLVVPGNSNTGTLLKELKQGHHGAPHGTSIIADVTSWVNAGCPNN